MVIEFTMESQHEQFRRLVADAIEIKINDGMFFPGIVAFADPQIIKKFLEWEGFDIASVDVAIAITTKVFTLIVAKIGDFNLPIFVCD